MVLNFSKNDSTTRRALKNKLFFKSSANSQASIICWSPLVAKFYVYKLQPAAL